MCVCELQQRYTSMVIRFVDICGGYHFWFQITQIFVRWRAEPSTCPRLSKWSGHATASVLQKMAWQWSWQAADAMLKDGHTADMDAPWFLQRWEMRGFRANLGLSNSDQISYGLPIKFQSAPVEYPRSPHNGESGATKSFPTTSQGVWCIHVGCSPSH